MGRHETFQNAAPIAEAMLASTILGRPLEQYPSSVVTAAGDDAVHALITEHRAAYAEWDRLSAVWNEMVPDDPGYAAAMAASKEPERREVAAFDALFSARPTTLAGAAALASYLVEAVRRTNPNPTPSEGERALSTVAAALRGLEPSRVALADVGLTSKISEDVFAAIEEHAEAIAAGRAEPDDSDEAFNRHAARQDLADKALQGAPVRSLADLRAKLLYLAPQIIRDVAGSAEAEHLQAICDDMDRLCRERSRPAEDHEDVELLRLGEQLDRLHARWRLVEWQKLESQERLNAAMKAASARGGPTADDIKAAWDLPGVTETHDAAEAAFLDLDPVRDAIWRTPAATPAGLAVKARAALTCIWPNAEFERDAALGEDEDLSGQVARRLIESCCSLAGVDWRGDPIAAAIDTQQPDILRSATTKTGGTLAGQILTVWAAHAELHDDAEALALDDLRSALIDEVDRLPAMKQHLFAKALAFAWIGYPDLWEAGRAREEYATDGRLVLDINAIVRTFAAPEAESGVEPLQLAEPLRDRAGAEQRSTPDLVDMLDLSSASLDDLRALRETADMVGGTAYAVCWQSRCHARGWSEQNPPADQYNVAGQLMQWLGEALTDVETAVDRELARRVPGNSHDRETWLSMRAWPVINDGEPDAIEAFARELLAHAQAEREGR